MLITSASNPKVQRLQKLLRMKKARQAEGVFVAEGIRLLEEAVRWNIAPLEFYFGETISERGQGLVDKLAPRAEIVYQLADHLIEKVTETGSSQGVLGVFRIQMELPANSRFLLIADLVRDPGNLGTLMRSAKAMGVEGIITTPGTVDAFSPKVVRSAMGVHFALPVLNLSWKEILVQYPKGTVQFWTTVVDGGRSIIEQQLQFPLALVVGGEAHGVSKEALSRSDVNVTIPMLGNTESMNAGIAGSIALYEILRKQLVK